jgi:hypothetical protein
MRIRGADGACSPNLQITYFLTSVPIFPVLKVLHALEVKLHVEPVQV